MYRIVFDPRSAAWIIQLQEWGFIWRTIQAAEKLRMFAEYDQAAAYVLQVGLDKVYRNYADSTVHVMMQGGYQPVPSVLRSNRA